MLFFNIPGILMMGASFLLTELIFNVLNFSEDTNKMLIAAPLMILADGLYRWKSEFGHWVLPNGGGNLFFIPIWFIGLVVFIPAIFS